jgi:acetyl-CoA carboxylase carboxyltransferase component
MADELHDWKPLVDDLRQRDDAALAMGGAERVERQRGMGKLPVRERVDLLLDPGTFVEYGRLADSMDPGLADKGYLAADGMVAGIGEVDGRRVAVMAYDFTVMAGSMGAVGEHKTARMRELARASSRRSARPSPRRGRCSASRSPCRASFPRWPPCSATAPPAPPTSPPWPTSCRW